MGADVYIKPAESTRVIKPKSFGKSIFESTAQEQVIAHPTDCKLLENAGQQLVQPAAEGVLVLPTPTMQAHTWQLEEAENDGWPRVTLRGTASHEAACHHAGKGGRIVGQDQTPVDPKAEGQE